MIKKIKSVPYLLRCVFIFLSLGMVVIHMGGCGGSGGGSGGESSMPDKEELVVFEGSQYPRSVLGEETYEFAQLAKASDMHYAMTPSDGKVTFPCIHFDKSINEVEIELKNAEDNSISNAEIIMMASDGEIIVLVRPRSDEYLPDFVRIKKTDLTIIGEIAKVIINISASNTAIGAGKALIRREENPPDFSEWERSYAVRYMEGQVCKTTMMGTVDHLCDIYKSLSAQRHEIFAKVTKVKEDEEVSRIHTLYSIAIKGSADVAVQEIEETALHETMCSAFKKIFDVEDLDPDRNYQINLYTVGAPYIVGSEFPFCIEIIELGVEQMCEIEITSHSDEDTLYERIIRLEGRVSDPNIGNVIISHNGIETLINVKSGSFSNPLVLESDRNLIWAGVRNEYGVIVGLEEIMLINEASPSADDVMITLTWDKNYIDLDLYVIEPNGEAAYFYHANNDLPDYCDGISATQSGGSIDIANIEGYGPENYYVNTFSEEDTILDGYYTIRVHHFFDYYLGDRFTKKFGEGTPVNFKVTVITNTGFRWEYNGSLNYFNANNWNPSDTGPDWADIGEFNFKNGPVVRKEATK